MLPCISQICTLHASLEKDIEDYAAGHCPAIELWLGKVEGWLESRSVADLKSLLAAHSIAAPVASFQGGLLNSQGEARKEHWAHFERRLTMLAELGVGTLVVACDVHGSLTQQDLERVQMSLTQVAQSAGKSGVRVALEFQASAVFGNNLQTAAALVGEVGSPHLGICLDAFHYHVGPSKPQDIGYLTPANLFHVQFCDLMDTPRELAADGDRILPGDGDFQLQPIVDHLKAIDYRGAVSIETMNPTIWEIPPRQFGEIAVTSLRKVLGLASMG